MTAEHDGPTNPELDNPNQGQLFNANLGQNDTDVSGVPHSGEPVVHEFDNTPLADAHARGWLTTPDDPSTIPSNMPGIEEVQTPHTNIADSENVIPPAPVLPEAQEEPNKVGFLRTKTGKWVAALSGIVALGGAGLGIGLSQKSGGSAPERSASISTPNKTPQASTPEQRMLHKLDQLAEEYGVTRKTVPYNTYIEGTRQYAKSEDLPNSYYDLSAIAKPLTIEDYKELAPILMYNSLLVQNTNNVHYLDMGQGTQFGNKITQTIPEVLIAPSPDTDNQGNKLPLGTFDSINSSNLKVYRAPYTGTISKFDGQTVIHVDLSHIYVRWETTDGYTNGFGNDPSQYPPLSDPVENGSTYNLSMQFDPKTNNIIAQSYSLK